MLLFKFVGIQSSEKINSPDHLLEIGMNKSFITSKWYMCIFFKFMIYINAS